MLERTARCIETASQKIFLCSKSPFRSQRTLQSHFWRHGAVDIDIPLWCFGFLYSPSSPSQADCTGKKQGNLSNRSSLSTHLEFLYPPRTQSFVRSYLRTRALHKSTGLRRRKRFSYRGFASAVDEAEDVSHGSSAGVSETPRVPIDDEAADSLRQLLENESSPDYDKAWDLFQAAKTPYGLVFQMLVYLSSSYRPVDVARTKLLFNRIPISERKARDYLYAAKAAMVRSSDDFQVIDIYNEAASRGEEALCWSFAITFLLNRKKWHDALEIWNNRPISGPFVGAQTEAAELSELAVLPPRIFSLLKAIRGGNLSRSTPGLVDLVKYLVYHLFSSQKIMMDVSTKWIMSLLERLDSLKLLEARLYLKGISTLQSLRVRPASTRSILLYRNFRWRLPNERVPEQVLISLIKTLSSLEISDSVDYLLDEYRFLYEKPSPEAYRYGLITYARLGKEPEVKRLFQRFVQDYGIPSDLKLLSSLLYVHARVGQVEQTRKQLNRLSVEFNVSPNVVCWNILLTAHARADDLKGAIATFKNMIQNDISPDTHSFGILMGLLAKNGDVDAVIDLFGIAKQNNTPISSAMIDGVVGALCNNRRYNDAEKVANEALHVNMSGSLSRMWNVLLWNYAFISDIDSVSRIQTQMQREGIDFDGMTYAALMLSLIRIGKLESARQILGKLHRSRRIHITELHYAILLRGYLKEKNRDMILVLYKEMAERFGTLGLSGNLSMLKAHIHRDLQRFSEKEGLGSDQSLELTRAERFLDVVMKNFDISNLATKQPQPGTEKRSIQDAFPSAYYEPLVLTYSSQGEFDKASSLLDKYNSKMKDLSREQKSPSLQLLHAQMTSFLREGKHAEVDMCWKTAVDSTISAACPIDCKALMSRTPGTESENPDDSRGQHQESPSKNDPTPKILPSYRFALSRCISVLMQSLSYRDLHSKIADIISEVERLGFILTSFNWSLYIKLLCLSRRPADQFRAFTIFEEKFISSFLSWGHIRRGYTKRPDNAPAGLDFLERKFSPLRQYQVLGKAGRNAWAKIHPDSMQPTYLTMLYLASALIDFRSRSIADGAEEMDRLVSKAPETVSAVAKLPFLREKFQGLILRGRRYMDDELGPKPIDTANHAVWTGGILGMDGEPRIDTSPVARATEDEEVADSSKARKTPKRLPGPGEDNSEPVADMLEAMLAEDAEWRTAHLKRGTSSEPRPAQRILEAQDELDLEIESRLEEQQDEE
ncbi:pentatricopeptide-repeat-containing protein [Emydomyces testavorans]|uniref:Pentatricopeptide-repeat-containing protein n=1 Tax=Emydomyces testavorans TaxID=2070801 RepID=A0AAF0DFL5_9EURO|nr:pentatricopeptide-repeat-containing protein [Emydomyces testavorans]